MLISNRREVIFMNRKLIILTAAFTLAVPTALVFAKYSKVNEAEAYDNYWTKSKLPKNIDLNDTEDSVIRSYYANASGYRGDDLLIHLKDILKTNQKYFSYESGDAIWAAYEITDRDWVKSPASDISGYDSTTNTITGYSYGTNADNIYIHALYVNRNVINKTVAGEHSDLAWGINQEHVWAKSHGFDANGKGGARGDLMHLIAGNARVNQTEHNNNYFGYVDLEQEYTTPNTGSYKTKYAHLSGNYMGFSKTISGSDVKVFEPQDADKGDIARAIFYLVARYNYLSGVDSDGIDSNNPNLELVNVLSTWQKPGYQSTTTKTGKMGLVQDLLEWNKLDPVDEYEIHRNNILYNNYTFNRNPFIDFPEWADIIWGDKTGTANPAADPINDKAGVVLSTTELNVNYPHPGTLSAVSSDKSGITWSISDSTVATLSKSTSASGENITITPLKKGTATITASATIVGKSETAECALTVKTPLSSIAVTGTPATIVRNTTFSFSGTCTATYTDGSHKEVTPTVTPIDTSVLGVKTVNVSYTEEGITKKTTYNIEVVKPVLESIAVQSPKTLYGVGDTFVNPQVIATYVNGDTEDVSASVTFTGNDTSSVSDSRTVTASYTEGGITKTDTFNIKVESDAPILQSIEVQSTLTEFALNDEFVFEGTVTATYDKGPTANVIPTSISEVNMGVVGPQTVTVSYTEGGITETDTYTINVNNVVDHLTVAGQKDIFKLGEDFIFGGVANLVYKDGTHERVEPTNISSPDMNALGVQDVTVTYGTGADAISCVYQITVKNYVASITVSGQKIDYKYGDSFEFNGSVTANYADGTSEIVTPTSVSAPDMEKVGPQDVTVTYTEDGETVTKDVEINISNILTGIAVSEQKTTYYKGDTFEFEGVVTASYIDGSTRAIQDGYTCTVTPSNMNVLGNKTVTVSYTEDGVTKSTVYTITVVNPTPVSIAVSGQKTEYKTGDDFEKPTVTLTYNNGSTEVVTSQCMFTGYDLSKAGEQTVTVTYEVEDGDDLTATYTITVTGGGILPSLGCGGSVATTSIILSVMSLTGIGLLLLKKKKQY